VTQAGGCADNACRRRPPDQSGSGVAALTVRSAPAKTSKRNYTTDAVRYRAAHGRADDGAERAGSGVKRAYRLSGSLGLVRNP
jgi:hypothetical protein